MTYKPTKDQIERAAKAMFEDPDLWGDYPWAQVVSDDPSRAYIWRKCAERYLIATGPLEEGITRAEADLAQALVHTAQYVGRELLPARQGWPWYDALKKHFPAMLENLINPTPSPLTVTFDVVARCGCQSSFDGEGDGNCQVHKA